MILRLRRTCWQTRLMNYTLNSGLSLFLVRKITLLVTPNKVDDILLAITSLDEKLLTKRLPCFISADPDRMPSLKLFDGDLSAVMTKLYKKMEEVVTAVCQGFDRSSNTLSLLMSMKRDNANTSRLGLRNIRQKNQRETSTGLPAQYSSLALDTV